jgi:hypothetical protein
VQDRVVVMSVKRFLGLLIDDTVMYRYVVGVCCVILFLFLKTVNYYLS